MWPRCIHLSVCLSVCSYLSVSNFTETRMNGFPRIFQDMLDMIREANDKLTCDLQPVYFAHISQSVLSETGDISHDSHKNSILGTVAKPRIKPHSAHGLATVNAKTDHNKPFSTFHGLLLLYLYCTSSQNLPNTPKAKLPAKTIIGRNEAALRT